MSDLVNRLNVYGTGSSASLLLMREAADRIEALEAALREIASGYPSPSDARLGRLMQIARAALTQEQDK